jgi:hypothetical protein
LPPSKFSHGLAATVLLNGKEVNIRIGKVLAEQITSMDAKEFFLASEREKSEEFSHWLNKDMRAKLVLNHRHGDVYITTLYSCGLCKRPAPEPLEYGTPTKAKANDAVIASTAIPSVMESNTVDCAHADTEYTQTAAPPRISGINSEGAGCSSDST